MAGSLNKVTLIGNIGRDPEIRSLQDGREVANLSVATSESWKDKSTGEKKERTEWHRVVVFSQPLIGLIKNYITKGSKLYIEGSLQTRKWSDQSGVERYTTEVVLQAYGGSLVMLDNKGSNENYSDSSSASSQGSATGTDGYQVQDMDDEIPF